MNNPDQELQRAIGGAVAKYQTDLIARIEQVAQLTADCTGYRQRLEAANSERDALRDLLRIEYLRNNHFFDGPWKCVESDCPYFGKPVASSRHGCNCYLEFKRKHIAAVKKELGL